MKISPYIDAMNNESKGPIEAEIEKRLMAGLSPSKLLITNDSAMHSGHSGDNGSGESHFSVEIESDQFVGKNRVAMQRMVNSALGDLMDEKVHAMAIKASAPK